MNFYGFLSFCTLTSILLWFISIIKPSLILGRILKNPNITRLYVLSRTTPLLIFLYVFTDSLAPDQKGAQALSAKTEAKVEVPLISQPSEHQAAEAPVEAPVKTDEAKKHSEVQPFKKAVVELQHPQKEVAESGFSAQKKMKFTPQLSTETVYPPALSGFFLPSEKSSSINGVPVKSYKSKNNAGSISFVGFKDNLREVKLSISASDDKDVGDQQDQMVDAFLSTMFPESFAKDFHNEVNNTMARKQESFKLERRLAGKVVRVSAHATRDNCSFTYIVVPD